MTRCAFRARLLLGSLIVVSAFALPGAARADGWGTLQGVVAWEGDVPEREKIKVDKDQAACLAKGPLYSEDFLINKKNKGVKNVFVWLIDASGDHKKPLPIHPKLKDSPLPDVVIDQPCCQFIPHVMAMREGQSLVVKNTATIAHNVHGIGAALVNEFNVILPPGGMRRIDAAEIHAHHTPILVKCDIHGWMNSWIRVFAHPYFAVTDEDGKFTIKDAPAGEWHVVIWQEKKGWVKGAKGGTPVAIKDGETTDLGTIPLTPPKD
jgi:hypothetical protein